MEEILASTHLCKEAVVAIAITLNLIDRTQRTRYVNVHALSCDSDGSCLGHIELEGDDEIISVVPAPPKSYRVTGLTKDRKWAELGYEFDGADHPDWLKVLKDEFW